MNLHKKITLAFVGVIAVFALGSYFALSKTLIPAFDELEKQAAEQDVIRARNGIRSYGRVLSYTSTDWGQWDEAHAFMLDQNPDFEAENLEAASLIALDLNVMAFYDLAGKLRWGMFVDSTTGTPAPVNELIISNQVATRLQKHPSSTSEILGLIDSGPGPMVVSVRPIVHSDRSGPVVGTFVVGRLLDETRLVNLRETARVAMDIARPSATNTPTEKRADQQMFGNTEQLLNEGSRTTRQLMHDIDGAVVGVLSVTSERAISGLQQDTVTSLILLFGGLGALIIVGLWYILSSLVVRPVTELRQKMTTIEQGGDLSDRIDLQRSDEIGDLANAFDNMLHELDEARRQHIDQSFKAGMAEVAAGVLHNIRNSLMPISNHVAMARATVTKASSANVRRAVDELLDDNVAADRREKLLRYLQSARDRTDEQHVTIAYDLDSATEQLDHVVAILRDQEKYTHAEPVLERVNVAELVAEASAVIPANDDLDVALEIDDDAANCNVSAHRIGLLQVLNNVLLNAYESIARTSDARGLISVRANVEQDSEDVRITIRDTGYGIEADVLEHIFDRGYTSKTEGSGGLGLHWSANAVATMDGDMSVFSEGPGQGAEIHVTLKAA